MELQKKKNPSCTCCKYEYIHAGCIYVSDPIVKVE